MVFWLVGDPFLCFVLFWDVVGLSLGGSVCVVFSLKPSWLAGTNC